MRAVVDTNILIRALLKPTGTVAPILGRLRDGDYTILHSHELLEEIVGVLNRPRFRLKYGIQGEDVEALLALIVLQGESIVCRERIQVCRDPDDDKLLEIAVGGEAEVIVTGDEDLLVLTPFRGIPILSPAKFLQRLGESR
ncbi:MAG TPA: putative toxin-antitoxin system toxin component, PIN family [Thermoanaerobaculia bacterium]|jgi:putative PIN family toxin of toxin-antitoxin system|nr:putative toxin-antitoxin system toxin component, PIN family [Thermoanaerobaculia bacterium]